MKSTTLELSMANILCPFITWKEFFFSEILFSIGEKRVDKKKQPPSTIFVNAIFTYLGQFFVLRKNIFHLDKFKI